MSIAINTDSVEAVLLAGHGWLSVKIGSFVIDAYEFGDYDREDVYHVVHGGGDGGVCSAGYTFIEDDTGSRARFSGPLTAILAVREDE